jgi:TatD DNase family protein
MNLTDTHLHLTDKPYIDCVSETLSKSVNNGVRNFIVPGYSVESWQSIQHLKQHYPELSTAIGLHPGYITFETLSDYDIDQYIFETKPVAIGETGLDYRKAFPSRTVQERLFSQHVTLSLEWNKPIMIHCVGAHQACISILKRFTKRSLLRGVLHRASCSIQVAEQYVNLGFYLGFGPDLFNTSRKRLQLLAKWTPANKILVETDAPYCKNFQGDIYHPWMLPELVEYISQLKNIPVSDMSRFIEQNTFTLFGV